MSDAYRIARERYAELGVDAHQARSRLRTIPISLPCWQGDDVTGFEKRGSELGGGLAVTGNHPGRARSADELRQDLEAALALIPGRHRVNLHALYAETEGEVDRNALEPDHFRGWIDWARSRGIGLDFNPSFFSHPLAGDGRTLSHPEETVRGFWIEHGVRSRRIGAALGKALGSPCITNVWIPDGSKDLPVDRRGPRERLVASLDAIFAEPLPESEVLDAVESKLFGIGSEAYVVGSHELYFGYAASRGKLLCLDTGHFHPTESVADKISATLPWVPGILLHVSRGVRWDSDHVPLLSDEVLALAAEIVRGEFLDRVHFGLDFFDASINRVAAWVIGARAVLKALLRALLEPRDRLLECERSGDLTGRLALLEQIKSLPFGAVWEAHCEETQTPGENAWMEKIRRYETTVLSRR